MTTIAEYLCHLRADREAARFSEETRINKMIHDALIGAGINITIDGIDGGRCLDIRPPFIYYTAVATESDMRYEVRVQYDRVNDEYSMPDISLSGD